MAAFETRPCSSSRCAPQASCLQRKYFTVPGGLLRGGTPGNEVKAVSHLFQTVLHSLAGDWNRMHLPRDPNDSPLLACSVSHAKSWNDYREAVVSPAELFMCEALDDLRLVYDYVVYSSNRIQTFNSKRALSSR